MRLCLLLLVPLIGFLCGCPVMQSQDTPVMQKHIEPRGGHNGYWIYVPNTYTPDRSWPLVIALHGTYLFDEAGPQIRQWKALAQEKGFIVAAPHLRSVQGILPVARSLWFRDLEKDDAVIVAVRDEICSQYKIDTRAVLLTGFSAGGYPLYNTGLRHPDKFTTLIAMSCNSDDETFDKIKLTDQARRMPIVVFWGKDDRLIQEQCWRAVRYFGTHGFKDFLHRKIPGGHLRRPEEAYKFWRKHLPQSQPASAPN